MAKMIMVLGAPASGKSSIAKEYAKILDAVYLNRDSVGGTVNGLLPMTEQALKDDKSVILDNLFTTVESRKPFLDLAKKMGASAKASWLTTSIEDATINALHRMWERYGKLFLTTDDLKEVKKDPNMFPIVVLFKYKKEFQKPTTEEGFDYIDVRKFFRKVDPSKNNKALILDYDQTLRDVVDGEYAYPTNPSQIKILPNRTEVIKRYQKDGYLILGASNQSGVAKKILTYQDAVQCFDTTNTRLGVSIDYKFCPHSVPPTCYCRKPQSGIGVWFIEQYKLNPKDCIFVGDQTTDKTFAERLSFQYVDQAEFFK